MNRVLFSAVMAGLVLVATPAAHAATITKQLQVTAEIEPFCAINVFPLEFGLYTTANINGGVDLDSTGSIYVICPDDVAYTVALDEGLNSPEAGVACEPGAPSPSRSMTSTTPPYNGNLNYLLYSDAARTLGWGCSDVTTVAGTGNGLSFDNFTVYGRIPAGAVTVADTYSDTVTVTVTF